MSAGRYNRTAKYEDENGNIRPIRVQPETIAAWNPEPAGSSSGLYVKVGGGKRKLGTHARIARFEWKGAPPTGYDDRGTIALPILTSAAFLGLTFETDYAYLGGTLNLVGRTPESSR